MSKIDSKYQKLAGNSAFLLSFMRGQAVNYCAKALLKNKLEWSSYFLTMPKLGFLLLLFVLSLQSFSQIMVGGTMTNSETWTNENIYFVVQDLIVPEGIILTIEEGVEVRVDYGRGITVNSGAIRVQGTYNNIVRFIPNHVNVGEVWKWKGIVIVNANGETFINYAKVTMAEIAIRVEGCENIIIENSEFVDCQNLGVQFVNNRFCSLVSCKIERNYDGIEVLTSTLGVSVNNVIEKCIIRNQNHNIYIFREEAAEYRDNVIAENIIDSGNNGIWINYIGEPINSVNTIERNFIINNGTNVGYGLLLAHDSTIVSNNIFWNNNIAVFSEQKADNVAFFNNSFYQNDWTVLIGSGSENGEYLNNTFSANLSTMLSISEADNIITNNNFLHSCELEDIVLNNTNVDFSIPDNYWGTTDTSTISRMIYDYYDNPLLGKLEYLPYVGSIDTSNPISPPFNVIKQIVNNKVQVSWHSNQEIDLMGYQIYYGDYADYYFSDKNEIGYDTSFVFSENISISDSIAVTAYDSVTTNINPQLTGNESPFAFAVIYPYAGSDTIICKEISEYKITNVTIPFSSQGLLWTTSGDGFFNLPSSPTPVYSPGNMDVQNFGVVLALNVIAINGDTLTDKFTLSIFDNPIAFAGNDTIVALEDSIPLNNAIAMNYSNVNWITYGDGGFNFDTLVNPIYYPGVNDIENGFVNLQMMVHSKCGYASDSITVYIEPFFSIQGKVWDSNKTNHSVTIVAFKENNEGARAVQIESAESDGTFRFVKIRKGNYYLYALPDTNNIYNAAPCYYANDMRWQNAYLLPVYADVYDVDIQLSLIDFDLPDGEASISGHMERPDDSKFSGDIYCMPWFENSTSDFCNGGLSNSTVLLFNNTTTKLLDYTLTDDLGNFYFSSLPFGEYIVDAEKAGFSSLPSPIITLSPEHKNETGVVLQISHQKISVFLNPVAPKEVFSSVFPNPAYSEINIPYSNSLLLSSQIVVYDIFGNRVLSSNTAIEETSSIINLDISKLISGLYFGQIINSSQTIHFRFVKK